MSPGRLDRNFSESPDQSPRFSSTPSGDNHNDIENINYCFSDGDKEWWEGEECYEVEEEEDGELDMPEENVFNKHEFETRELSIVFEETEFEDSETDSDISDEDKVFFE